MIMYPDLFGLMPYRNKSNFLKRNSSTVLNVKIHTGCSFYIQLCYWPVENSCYYLWDAPWRWFLFKNYYILLLLWQLFWKRVVGIKFKIAHIPNTQALTCFKICFVVFVLLSVKYTEGLHDLQLIAFCFIYVTLCPNCLNRIVVDI